MPGDAFRDGKVHVCARMCSTCIFRPGNLMKLSPGRRAGMVRSAVAKDSAIICHQTLDENNAVCAGFFAQHSTNPLRIAERLGMIEYVEPT